MLDRISVNSGILHGKPHIAGTRIGVYMILDMLSGEYSVDDIIREYPDITKEDIKACLQYAAILAKEQVVELGVRQ